MDKVGETSRVVGKMNNSLYITIPAEFARQMNLKKGEGLLMRLENGSIIATPKEKDTTADDIRETDKLIDKYMKAMKFLEDK